MKTFKFTLRPLTPFGTPVAGDTLFGHFCWAARERNGDRGLAELLDGYVTGHPFLVVSDGFPAGLLPRPTAPDFALGHAIDPARRKRARTHRWLPADRVGERVPRWMAELTASDTAKPLVLTQNTINRYTGTTGTDQFAPRQVERSFFAESVQLDIYAVFDQARVSAEDLHELFQDIGMHGYGRDATTGLGKFAVESLEEHAWPGEDQPPHCHWLTLAPCVPDAEMLLAEGCYFLPLTRFGRHGNLAAVQDSPFKRPILMMGTGAVLKAREPAHWVFHGRGLGGREAPLSKTIPETVHQGYAPVVPLRLEGGA
jgi:CRISPR-associated protein Csm4